MKTAGSEIEPWYIIAGILLKGSFSNSWFLPIQQKGFQNFRGWVVKKNEEIP